jgi:hypothetical protein
MRLIEALSCAVQHKPLIARNKLRTRGRSGGGAGRAERVNARSANIFKGILQLRNSGKIMKKSAEKRQPETLRRAVYHAGINYNPDLRKHNDL